MFDYTKRCLSVPQHKKHLIMNAQIPLYAFLFYLLTLNACGYGHNKQDTAYIPTTPTDSNTHSLVESEATEQEPQKDRDIQNPPEIKTIHVFVPLCDNVYQGIVPVPEGIGNGQKPSTNLYWGCGYGIKHFFDKKTDNWELIQSTGRLNDTILDRRLFRHKDSAIYLLADAYNGKEIKACNEDMLGSLGGQFHTSVHYDSLLLQFGGQAELIAYTGHNGLMDFSLDLELTPPDKTKDCIILACMSKSYYSSFVQAAGARPLVWTTNFMAPEAYTLEWALQGWVLNETPKAIRERAAQAYNHYQKCGINGSRRLLVSGF